MISADDDEEEEVDDEIYTGESDGYSYDGEDYCLYNVVGFDRRFDSQMFDQNDELLSNTQNACMKIKMKNKSPLTKQIFESVFETLIQDVTMNEAVDSDKKTDQVEETDEIWWREINDVRRWKTPKIQELTKQIMKSH